MKGGTILMIIGGVTSILGTGLMLTSFAGGLLQSPATTGERTMRVFKVTPKGGEARLVEAAGPATARAHVARDIAVVEVKGRELIDLGKTMELETASGQADADVQGQGSAEAEAAARGDEPSGEDAEPKPKAGK
jgi:hypothetical protein